MTGRVVFDVWIVIATRPLALPLRNNVTVRRVRSQVMANCPPAKRATDCPSALLHCQSPGVAGAVRQSTSDLGSGGGGAGGGAGAGLGAGTGVGTIGCSEQEPASTAVMARAAIAVGRRRLYAFIVSLWYPLKDSSSLLLHE
ncbi:MAG: hypothetical protein P8J20_08370 [Novosphingobium sp.]|nr:hypothetical protein [Novosphingobium sp.]